MNNTLFIEVVSMEKLTGTGKTGPIYQSDQQTIVNIVFKAGETLPTHSAPNCVVVVPVRGTIQFRGEDFDERIAPGSVVRINPDEKHSLEALTDAEVMVIKSHLA